MFLVFTSLFLFVFGLIVGSFLNVQILRFGFSEVPSARSRCMACDSVIAWYDLIPLVSYVVLSGRCRKCGSALSMQYPLVELATGALFFWAYLSIPPQYDLLSIAGFLFLLGFFASLVLLVAYDIRHTIVPFPFLWALIVSATGATIAASLYTHSVSPALDGALGGGILFAFFMAVVVITGGRGMGAGDAYVAGAIGILLGLFRGIEAIMIGVWSGTAIALLMLMLSSVFQKNRLFKKNIRVTMKTELPLVPFLACGALVGIFSNFSPLQFVGTLIYLMPFNQ